LPREFAQSGFTASCGTAGDCSLAVITVSRCTSTERPDIGYAMIFPGMKIVEILFVDIIRALFSKF
jgi:putative transport protein